MPRATFGARLLGAGLIGAGLMIVAPAAAHATPVGETWWFTGITYPDTSAGYSSCASTGQFENSLGGSTNWSCKLGDPDAGVYNLWLAKFNPGP